MACSSRCPFVSPILPFGCRSAHNEKFYQLVEISCVSRPAGRGCGSSVRASRSPGRADGAVATVEAHPNAATDDCRLGSMGGARAYAWAEAWRWTMRALAPAVGDGGDLDAMKRYPNVDGYGGVALADALAKAGRCEEANARMEHAWKTGGGESLTVLELCPHAATLEPARRTARRRSPRRPHRRTRAARRAALPTPRPAWPGAMRHHHPKWKGIAPRWARRRAASVPPVARPPPPAPRRAAYRSQPAPPGSARAR